jgi:hypothetical protein
MLNPIGPEGRGLVPEGLTGPQRTSVTSGGALVEHNTKSRGSSVGRATGYGLDDRTVGVPVQVGAKIFTSPRRPERL